MKKLVLVKIGGSLITDKNKPFTLKPQVLDKIVNEIKKVFQTSDKQIIIGHGAGSFGHVVAHKYDTVNGAKGAKQILGMAEVAEAAIRLNREVVKRLLSKKVPAISVSPLSSFYSANKKFQSGCFKPIEKILNLGGLPIVYGDVVLDKKIGCTIFSTEKVLAEIGRYFLKNKGYQVEKIIHCGQTIGVYDQDGKTIPLINQKNFNQIEKNLNGSHGIDVTGGMIHKVEESLKLAKLGIPSLIIDGIEKGTLSQAIEGKSSDSEDKKVPGTRVEW